MEMMKALLYRAPGRANGSIAQVPRPACGSDQVVIKVMACGICKPAESSHDRNGSVLGAYPCIPGHEFAGEVAEVGASVRSVKVGDRVTADNSVPCGTCYYCKKGKPAYCEHFGSLGQNLPGGMAEYVLVDESRVFLIPEGIPYEHACLCELIGCCIHCVDRCGVNFGDTVAIFGAGSSGLILAQLFLRSGASEVIALDSEAGKLERIAKKGAVAIKVDRNDYSIHEKELLARHPRGVDIIIDTTGDAELMDRSLDLLSRGGKFACYSFPTSPRRAATLDMSKFIVRELSFLGSTFQSYSFGRALQAISNGTVDCGILVTNEYPLDQYFEALDKNMGDNATIKIIIHPNGPAESGIEERN